MAEENKWLMKTQIKFCDDGILFQSFQNEWIMVWANYAVFERSNYLSKKQKKKQIWTQRTLMRLITQIGCQIISLVINCFAINSDCFQIEWWELTIELNLCSNPKHSILSILDRCFWFYLSRNQPHRRSSSSFFCLGAFGWQSPVGFSGPRWSCHRPNISVGEGE